MSSITRFWSKVRKKYRCENVPPSEPGPSTESSSVLLDKGDTNSNPSEDSTKILEVTSPKPKKKYTQTQYEENTKSTKTTSEEETKCLTPTITAEELCTPVGCFVNLWKLRYSAGSQFVLTKDLLLLSLINEVTAVNPNFSISEPNNGITFICQCLEQIIETVRMLGWKDDSDPRCPVGSNFDIKIKKVIKCSRCAFQQNILHECNIITVPLEYKSVDQCLYNICHVRHGIVDCYTHRPPQWWTCNDELISLTTEEDVLQKSLSNAYLLLYERSTLTFICQCLEQIIKTVRMLGWKDDLDPRCPVGSNFDIKMKKVIKCSSCATSLHLFCTLLAHFPLIFHEKLVNRSCVNFLISCAQPSDIMVQEKQLNTRHGIVDCYTHSPPQWWTCNDELISLTTEKDVLQKSLSNACLLLYEKMSTE
ncbi:hypothetical protein C0J45_6353 [Silurus meridionalis]|nr:hypothetical protein C0J45_6353 [Silurus meridionalis]